MGDVMQCTFERAYDRAHDGRGQRQRQQRCQNRDGGISPEVGSGLAAQGLGHADDIRGNRVFHTLEPADLDRLPVEPLLWIHSETALVSALDGALPQATKTVDLGTGQGGLICVAHGRGSQRVEGFQERALGTDEVEKAPVQRRRHRVRGECVCQHGPLDTGEILGFQQIVVRGQRACDRGFAGHIAQFAGKTDERGVGARVVAQRIRQWYRQRIHAAAHGGGRIQALPSVVDPVADGGA